MNGEEFEKMILQMLSNKYGTFNGKLTIPNFNREERRKYIKEYKKDKNATICPHCKNRTLKITDDNGKNFCELCGKIIEYEDVGVISNERNR